MPKLIDWSAIPLKDAVTIFFAVIGGIVGLWQYSSTSRNEFLKPIREEQLKLYEEASSAAALLATAPKDSDEWKKAYIDFYRLYYGPLAMVENYRHTTTEPDANEITVERAMIAFEMELSRKPGPDAGTLQNLSLALAHTCRVSLGSSWGFHAEQLRGDYQNLINLKANQKH
jgi:hypothetical protein